MNLGELEEEGRSLDWRTAVGGPCRQQGWGGRGGGGRRGGGGASEIEILVFDRGRRSVLKIIIIIFFIELGLKNDSIQNKIQNIH